MSIQGELPVVIPEQTEDKSKLLEHLVQYKMEATNNRKSGLNPRDDKWRMNIDMYWNRYDFSDKADWQSQNVMPEVPGFVDRFAAAMKDAMVSTPNGFYNVTDPYDQEQDICNSIKDMTDVWLSVAGKNQVGQLLDFSSFFEEQMKMGAMMNCAGVVLWKDDVPGGRVAVESVDPRFVWLDHTYRDLYRIRRTEVDAIEIARMSKQKSSKGMNIYNIDEMSRLVGSLVMDQQRKKELSGIGQEETSDRKPIVLDEYIASVMDRDGNILMDNEVVVVANDGYIIRGPEKNPFWHKKDWMVYSPMMPVPLSPYGRTYMEDFASLAKVFNDLTNLILDATYMASMNAYAVVPAMLKDPTQLNTGVWPNKVFQLEEGYTAENFMKSIELGTLNQGAIDIWNNIKSELSLAAGQNDISMGQIPDKTHISANATAGAQQSASSMLRSIAQTVETRFLDPLLDLIWKTGLQHVSKNDSRMYQAMGDMAPALIGQRRELIKRPITFQARGISQLIQKQQQLSALLNLMQVLAQQPQLMQAFAQRLDLNKFIDLLFQLSNVDISKLEISARQQMINNITQPFQQAAQQGGGQGSPTGVQNMAGAMVQGMGMQKQG